ncbi:MAG: TrmB family transcriptional regulator [Calditrichia bacterium]
MSKVIIERMMKLGFTLYESRAYISLLREYPATRYEISKRSDVPRSAIYNVVQKLESAGIVNALSTDPIKYMPLPPDKLLNLIEKKHQSEVSQFRESVSNVHVGIERGQLWNVTGYTNLILKAKEIILNATEQLYISAWMREVTELRDELNEAQERGVLLTVFSLTELPDIFNIAYSYGFSETELELTEKRNLIIIRDSKEMLMGEANVEQPKKAAWTHNEAFIEISTNYIIQDIMLYGLRTGTDVSEVFNGIQSVGSESDKLPGVPYRSTNLSGRKLRTLVTKIPFKSVEEQ